MNLRRHIVALAAEIGPRPAASAAEAAAAAYVVRRLAESGLAAREERFRSVATFSWSQVAIYAGAVLAFTLSWVVPWSGPVLGSVIFLMFVGEIDTTRPVVSDLLAKGESRNVLGCVAPRRERAGLVVVSAHLDSARSAAAFAPARVGLFRATFLGAAFSLLFLPVVAGAALIVPAARLLGLPFALYLLVAIFLLLQRELAYRVVPGANDNASGVAVLLGVGEELARNPLEKLEVWLLATGSEEAGLVGMLHFRRDHARELDGACFINLDNLGRGELCWTTAEGMLFPRPTGERLRRAAAAAAGELGIAARGRPYLTMSTDAQVPLAAGSEEAMSLIALDPRGIPPDWHWETDVPERVDDRNLEDARRLAMGILRRLDRDPNR